MAEKLSKEQVARLKQAFALADKNGDNTIDAEELASVLKSLGYNPTEELLKTLIASMDTDHDGVINFQEFLEVMAKRMEMVGGQQGTLREAFRVFDLNNDGHISVAELKQVVANAGVEVSEEELDAMIREADVNQDGQVDYEEFVLKLTQQ
ncbi:uncharacterized protein LOC143689698 [Tamandua tetradactyla]|uniref:uncharacterized protein LOC143689698 n=1 Tax=Tamandua tetradactyla TaxID=48850 RepID=UPI0040544ABD